jgi:hypothetical protein
MPTMLSSSAQSASTVPTVLQSRYLALKVFIYVVEAELTTYLELARDLYLE